MIDSDYVLAVDPSLVSSGVALFHKEKLVAAGTIKLDTIGDDISMRCLKMGTAIVEWLAPKKIRPKHIVVEWPQVYRATRSKGDPNDLLPLSGVIMSVVSTLALVTAAHNIPLQIESYKPATWAGQLLKDKTQKGAKYSVRATRILSRLDDDEAVIFIECGKSHDAIDAIGIGLYALGRFEPRRVFDGASGTSIH